jgi:hypothetical protein
MAKVIVLVEDTMDFSEQLSNAFYNYEGGLDDFVEFIRKNFPKALCEPVEERVHGDVLEQDDRYIMTYEQHNMGDTMRIYEKQISKAWKEKIFSLFDAIQRSGIDNCHWGVCEDIDNSHYEWGTVGVLRFAGKWLYVYTDEDGVNPLGQWSMSVPEPDYELALERDGDEPLMNQSIVLYKLED